MTVKLTAPQKSMLLALIAADAGDRVGRSRHMRGVKLYGVVRNALLDKGLVDIIRTPNSKWLRDDIQLVLTEAGRAAAAEVQA